MKILYWKKPVEEDFAVESPANLDEIESFVVAELVRNKIKFDGDYHQYGELGAPVIELDSGDQYVYTTTWRHWGRLTADAWNQIEKSQKYDYIDFYMMYNEDMLLPDGTVLHRPAAEPDWEFLKL